MSSLYDSDWNLWCEETILKLKTGDFVNLDITHLIEEISALASRDRRELRSRLQVLLEHWLKRKYVDSYYDFRGWELTIKEQLRQIRELLTDSPSLRQFFEEIFDREYTFALSQVKIIYPHVNFPESWMSSTTTEGFMTMMERELANCS